MTCCQLPTCTGSIGLCSVTISECTRPSTSHSTPSHASNSTLPVCHSDSRPLSPPLRCSVPAGSMNAGACKGGRGLGVRHASYAPQRRWLAVLPRNAHAPLADTSCCSRVRRRRRNYTGPATTAPAHLLPTTTCLHSRLQLSIAKSVGRRRLRVTKAPRSPRPPLSRHA